jgi:multiple sugar transport system ATP-binding protein
VVYNKPANLFVARFLGTPPMNTLRARLVRDGDSLAAAIGSVTLPLPAQPDAARAFVDREVFLGLRPECITDAGRIGDHSPASFEAEVLTTEPTGAETIVLASVSGERLRARVAPDVRLAAGQRTAFLADTRSACLFDPATERLIA